MNRLTLMAGTAMVGALATSRWQVILSAVIGSFSAVDASVDRETWDDLVVKTRRSIGDQAAEQQLAQDWAQRLQRVLGAEPGLEAQLDHVVYDVLLPALPEAERTRVVRMSITAPRDQVISQNFLRSSNPIVR